MSQLTSRPRLFATLAVLATAGAALAPAPAAAQTTRAFQLCFISGARSCSFFDVTSSPYLDGGGARLGTAVEVFVRHAEGSAPGAAALSGLLGFSFHYAGLAATPVGGANVVDDVGVPLWQPMEQGSAPAPLNPAAWQLRAATTTAPAGDLYDSYLALDNTSYLDPGPDAGPVLTQAIGGCGTAGAGGAFDPVFATELWSCGAGSGYLFQLFTDAWFDVSLVNAIGVQTYARFEGEAYGASPFCTAYLDGPGSIGHDGTVDDAGFPSFGDVCAARDLSAPPPPTVTPEPGTVALLGSGLALLALIGRRRRGVVRGGAR